MSMLPTRARSARREISQSGARGISVRGLTKSFGSHTAVDHVDLDVQHGDFVVILGPSGCGKTTVLRMIAGLERPDSGTISIDGETVVSSNPRFSRPPESRKLGMVFQSYAVWPHMTVEQNVGFPLKLQAARDTDRGKRLAEVLSLVGLEHVAKRFPGQLSGGQQQRVALARALVAEPRAVLFDEPLSNLDAKLRGQLRNELSQIMLTRPFTGLYVTHDLTEAMGLAKQIVVMRDGSIAQQGTPEHLYRKPSSRFVAEFMGFSNFLSARVVGALPGGVELDVPLFGRLEAEVGGPTLRAGESCLLAIRATALLVHPATGGRTEGLQGMVRNARFFGESYTGTVEVGGHLLEIRSTLPLPSIGTPVSVEPQLSAGVIALPVDGSPGSGTEATPRIETPG